MTMEQYDLLSNSIKRRVKCASYLHRLKQLFECNNITNTEKLKPFLLTILEGHAYGVLKVLLPAASKSQE